MGRQRLTKCMNGSNCFIRGCFLRPVMANNMSICFAYVICNFLYMYSINCASRCGLFLIIMSYECLMIVCNDLEGKWILKAWKIDNLI